MKPLTYPMIYFSIDNVTHHYTLSKFLHEMDKRAAMQKMKPLRITHGCYEGVIELTFACSEQDFVRNVLPSGFVNNQRTFLRVHNGAADMIHNDTSVYAEDEPLQAMQWDEDLGETITVTWEEAKQEQGWTAIAGTNFYFIIKPFTGE